MQPVFIVLIAAIALQACNGKAMQQNLKSEETIAVKLLPLDPRPSSTQIQGSGLLQTEDEAKLSFKIGGIIESISVEEGQHVKKGQLLATLKSTEIAAQVQQIRITIDKAQRDYQRALNLYNDSVATLEQLQNARTGLEIAKQNYQQVAFNQAYSKIYAPSDGFIAKKIGSVGELANPGSPVLIVNAVSGNSQWVLKLGVPDKEWALTSVGNKATIQLDAFGSRQFSGRVSKKTLAADGANGTIAVEIAVNLEGVQPASGMFGKAIIYTEKSTSVYHIPYEALLEANGKYGFVFISDDQKTVQKIPVTIGKIKENNVEITDGLQSHAYLVTSGSPYLSENSKIIVSK